MTLGFILLNSITPSFYASASIFICSSSISSYIYADSSSITLSSYLISSIPYLADKKLVIGMKFSTIFLAPVFGGLNDRYGSSWNFKFAFFMRVNSGSVCCGVWMTVWDRFCFYCWAGLGWTGACKVIWGLCWQKIRRRVLLILAIA